MDGQPGLKARKQGGRENPGPNRSGHMFPDARQARVLVIHGNDPVVVGHAHVPDIQVMDGGVDEVGVTYNYRIVTMD